MDTFLLTSGIVVIVAAIVGGQVKGAGMEFPLIASHRRQFALALFGVVLFLYGLDFHDSDAKHEVVKDPSTLDLSPKNHRRSLLYG
jgi:hypothetical protein